ncbi:MAG: MoxR-like ATPase [halophilic archaeon J07HX64]|jgi:MoxR-like ATPases|nr:MAG: MoxR-like ATPase [halophilic archaeon J07HX64]
MQDEPADIEELTPLSVEDGAALTAEVIEQLREAVVADREFFELLLTGILARGHIQLEDVPGTGKTVAARTLAGALGVSFSRIQFTPDLLPADITGSYVYNEGDSSFEFQPGPVFANVVLADEINRAPPKTQAALLEAMGERQVSTDGTTHPLPKPFFVVATQNPIEQEGTFELPEAQRDRFAVKTSLGYPGHDGEIELLDRREDRRSQLPSVDAVTDPQTVRRLQVTAEEIAVDDVIKEYVVDLATCTRRDSRVDVGVSPRGVQALFEAARALAVIRGRGYVTPDDVKRLARPVYAHRVVLTTDASIRSVDRRTVVGDALGSTTVPGMDEETAAR